MSSHQQQGYETACALAAEQFAAADPGELARRSMTELLTDPVRLRVSYLQQPYDIAWPSGRVYRVEDGEDARAAVAVLLLNYVRHANQQPTGQVIAFRDIPGAATYEGPFSKRAVNPLVKTFNGKPDLFGAAAERLGGERVPVGDDAYRLTILPLLPVTYALWHGDEEFPPSGSILFDASARRLLPIECLVVAASNGVYALLGVARGLG